MSVFGAATPQDPLLDLPRYAAALESWLADPPEVLRTVARPIPVFEQRVRAMSDLMAVLFDAGWSRYGWPEEVGGLGGTILHRAAMWEALARHGVPGMALFEHLEVLAPTLAAKGPRPLVADLLPELLAGRQLWCQGFSEPGAGSDLASLRTTARRADTGGRDSGTGDGFVVNGRKIWTSWARYATWCLLLARTGTPESRHRGLTALVVDLRSPGVDVRPIEQANGTDELAEVAFDDVVVPASRVVGEVDGGWAVAVHILSHERGTFAWFRHLFLYQHLRAYLDDPGASPTTGAAHDAALGDVLLDLAAVTATGHAGLHAHARDLPLGPMAAHHKLLLCAAEQSVHDWILAGDPGLALEVDDDELAVRRQEYLFSRIVTVYGGSQQMQLETIAKQILGLP
jgi:alkylation response protein AidB-like acyl-CoA dehydrogenase